MLITPGIRFAALTATLDALDEALKRGETGELPTALVTIARDEVAKLQTASTSAAGKATPNRSAQILPFSRRSSVEHATVG